MCSFSSLALICVLKLYNIQPNGSVYIGKVFNFHMIALVRKYVLRLIV